VMGLNLFVLSAFITMGHARRLKFTSRPAGDNAIRAHWMAKDGEHDYLKEVLGDKALSWVKERNEHSVAHLGDPFKTRLYDKVLSILDSKDKIPYLRKINDLYYNFWQDKENPRGVWRRTTMESYLSKSPKWETVIDFDALGKAENESWVYKGHTIFEPDSVNGKMGRVTRTMMQLSRGGADAVVLREFDLDRKSFVSEAEDGFVVPESKSRVAWKSKDILLIGTSCCSIAASSSHLRATSVASVRLFSCAFVPMITGTDLKDGQSMTDSGYPRVMRQWPRGTPLSSAQAVHEGAQTDVSVYMYVAQHREHKYLLRGRAITFYTSKNEVFLPEGGSEGDGKWHELPVQEGAEVSIFADQVLVQLRADWSIGGGTSGQEARTVKQGSLLAAPVRDLVQHGAQGKLLCACPQYVP
jgi:prolyl oligopeptidase